jgi:murein DD-endopeptidase MepM/ murein hydrolase activator NlpD
MTNGYYPGSRFTLRSRYGNRTDPITGASGKFHSGLDFAAPAGTPIPAAGSGTVVYAGYNNRLGNVVIVKNDAGDYSLYGHMRDTSQLGLGQRLWQGDAVGVVGSTGLRSTGNHLHYSIIPGEAGRVIEKIPRHGGPIGVPLDEDNTIDPAGYDNYDPTPRHLDASRRATQVMSGTDSGVTPGGLSPDPSISFADRFGGSRSPADGIVQNLDPRTLLPQPGGAAGVAGTAPERFLRTYIAGKPASSIFDTGAPGVPAFPPNDALSPGRPASLNDRFGNWTASPEGGISPANPNLPEPPAETGRPLGIVSGQPMPQWVTPPPIFGQRDPSKAPVDEGREWLMRMIRSMDAY